MKGLHFLFYGPFLGLDTPFYFPLFQRGLSIYCISYLLSFPIVPRFGHFERVSPLNSGPRRHRLSEGASSPPGLLSTSKGLLGLSFLSRPTSMIRPEQVLPPGKGA